jgi:putative SOS response-associated peptidase YedK
VWFAFDETRPLAFFAGLWTNWTFGEKLKEGETTNDLFGFLTTEANQEVGAIHPKVLPVILTTPEEIDLWMAAPAEEANSCRDTSGTRPEVVRAKSLILWRARGDSNL